MAQQFNLFLSRGLLAIAKRPRLNVSSSHAFYQTLTLPSHSQSQNQYAPFNFNFNLDFDDPTLLQFVELLKTEAEAEGFRANRDLICSAIWALREDWQHSLRAFKWNTHLHNDEKVCNLMIWVLGTHAKFSTAWCIVRDMHRASLSTREAMLIMIDR